MPSYGFKPEEVRWGTERNPKRKELVQLKQPFPAGEGIQIEWLYSYIARKDNQNRSGGFGILCGTGGIISKTKALN